MVRPDCWKPGDLSRADEVGDQARASLVDAGATFRTGRPKWKLTVLSLSPAMECDQPTVVITVVAEGDLYFVSGAVMPREVAGGQARTQAFVEDAEATLNIFWIALMLQRDRRNS